MKTVLILSGGMDSSVLLADLHNKKVQVSTLTFDYGSKHNKQEKRAAKSITEYFKVGNILVKLPFVNELFKSDLLQSGGNIPEGHYQDLSMKWTVVPFRNSIMLMIAAGYAESIGAQSVSIANHAGDHTIYPDCRLIYIGAMREVFRLGGYERLKLDSPYVSISKRAIALLGRSLGIPFEITYSCYKGGKKHCGKCGTCVERKEALTGFDPTEYE